MEINTLYLAASVADPICFPECLARRYEDSRSSVADQFKKLGDERRWIVVRMPVKAEFIKPIEDRDQKLLAHQKLKKLLVRESDCLGYDLQDGGIEYVGQCQVDQILPLRKLD